MGFLTIFYKYMIQQYYCHRTSLCLLAIFKTNKISNAVFGNIRYVNFDHIWQRQIKQFVYASNIILIETNMPFPAQVKFPQNYINELYKNLL